MVTGTGTETGTGSGTGTGIVTVTVTLPQRIVTLPQKNVTGTILGVLRPLVCLHHYAGVRPCIL